MKTQWIIIFFMSITLSACGYTLQGTQKTSAITVLGSGNKTLAIESVEQASLLPWISHYLRTQIHDEVNLRKIARWVSIEDADYLMQVRFPSFKTRAFISGQEDETLLNSVTVELDVQIYDKNKNIIWSSGPVFYSKNYENVREDEAIREILKEAVYILLDRLQFEF